MKKETAPFRGWQKIAALYLKKSLLPVAAVLVLTVGLQLLGFRRAVRQAASLGFALPQDGTESLPWAPRLEGLMARGFWHPLFIAGLILTLAVCLLTPLRLCGGSRGCATLRRMPFGSAALLLGSSVCGSVLALCFWAAEFATLPACWLLYSKMIPQELQIPDALLMALLRWDVLNGLFPAARTGLLALMPLLLMAMAVTACCTGWLFANRQWGGWASLLLTILACPGFLCYAGIHPLKHWFAWALPLLLAAAAVSVTRRRIRQDPLS
ncbi:MAG: hypothetical protein PUC47_03450 [Oscillospiraceae bacterium]|nr:hypothetical protein [Oscillospiraceae bacterium]